MVTLMLRHRQQQQQLMMTTQRVRKKLSDHGSACGMWRGKVCTHKIAEGSGLRIYKLVKEAVLASLLGTNALA